MALDDKFYLRFKDLYQLYYQHHRPSLLEQLPKCPKDQRDSLIERINHLDLIKKEIETGITKNNEDEENN